MCHAPDSFWLQKSGHESGGSQHRVQPREMWHSVASEGCQCNLEATSGLCAILSCSFLALASPRSTTDDAVDAQGQEFENPWSQAEPLQPSESVLGRFYGRVELSDGLSFAIGGLHKSCPVTFHRVITLQRSCCRTSPYHSVTKEQVWECPFSFSGWSRFKLDGQQRAISQPRMHCDF